MTYEISKFDKSNSNSSLHELNIDSIFVTLFVLKLFNPSIFSKLIHPLNINERSVTFLVSKHSREVVQDLQ